MSAGSESQPSSAQPRRSWPGESRLSISECPTHSFGLWHRALVYAKQGEYLREVSLSRRLPPEFLESEGLLQLRRTQSLKGPAPERTSTGGVQHRWGRNKSRASRKSAFHAPKRVDPWHPI